MHSSIFNQSINLSMCAVQTSINQFSQCVQFKLLSINSMNVYMLYECVQFKLLSTNSINVCSSNFYQPILSMCAVQTSINQFYECVQFKLLSINSMNVYMLYECVQFKLLSTNSINVCSSNFYQPILSMCAVQTSINQFYECVHVV